MCGCLGFEWVSENSWASWLLRFQSKISSLSWTKGFDHQVTLPWPFQRPPGRQLAPFCFIQSSRHLKRCRASDWYIRTRSSTSRWLLSIIWVSPKILVPQNGWFIMENHIKWMIWGYPYFWKHPYSYKYVASKGCTILDIQSPPVILYEEVWDPTKPTAVTQNLLLEHFGYVSEMHVLLKYFYWIILFFLQLVLYAKLTR